MKKQANQRSQYQIRYDRLTFIYQALLLDLNLDEIYQAISQLEDLKDQEFLTNWTGLINQVPTIVSAHLKESWSWNRLDYMIKALFNLVITEAKVLKTEKAILISQATKLIQEYGDLNSIKLVSAILNKVI
ncbi:transcription termination factor NusB [Mycoplasmoides gallisepticum]|uniref:Transcription termination factor N utilization substance protein B (NusB) n=4 Tax=Mycoplasmoides gallisepticum TaxID=2096 RepID=Q7NAX6_MYCGA|nr:transcription antitermination factor NusB [Mycoplasmoides gallisepticum]AAP56859.2 putative transcription termination factor N utilization substance protein B (NusB) [Mycoplasmoides gallisepticum str. R(low)]ADC30716.1 putative transcription termination factor N utilization substance protein B (NusB) [Mycoplasmoides gallisepticum str. R(high)]ADC31256.1 putative transcription termination factor N utilization substance protein B (NusB) [Mycoplasmoides gallisepticum str. F]OBU78908.1 transcrip